jgi:hypothetical protein
LGTNFDCNQQYFNYLVSPDARSNWIFFSVLMLVNNIGLRSS